MISMADAIRAADSALARVCRDDLAFVMEARDSLRAALPYAEAAEALADAARGFIDSRDRTIRHDSPLGRLVAALRRYREV